MGEWTGVDWGILAVAAFIAVSSLVRLMLVRRDRLLAEFRAKLEIEQQRLKADAKKPTAAPFQKTP
ncbi:MAG TPA: hypothetical protein VFE24_02955 [Pirellulales bacterium]|jgi:hypothetical protein|nr:hypothetical protein [Pirellulales bacterium]